MGPPRAPNLKPDVDARVHADLTKILDYTMMRIEYMECTVDVLNIDTQNKFENTIRTSDIRTLEFIKDANEQHTVDTHELVTKQRGITENFFKDNIEIVKESIQHLVTKVFELLQLKMQGLEDRLNQIVAKQEFATAQEYAIAEPLTQQSHTNPYRSTGVCYGMGFGTLTKDFAYAEHELGVQSDNDKSTICVPVHAGIGILSHAAAACKTSFNAVVSICNKLNHLMSSNQF